MKVNVKNFRAMYCTPELRNGLYVPEDIMVLCAHAEIDALMSGEEAVIEVPDNIDDIVNEARKQDVLRDKQYLDISCARIAGMKAEEDEDIDSAIEHYAEAIELGEASAFDMLHAYHHAYNRIFVLLSRTHAYAREVELIERLLKHDSLQDDDRAKLNDRLQKTLKKIQK